MNYTNVKEAEFLSRPNRFIAEVCLDGEIKVCHVKNTGRCRELRYPVPGCGYPKVTIPYERPGMI